MVFGLTEDGSGLSSEEPLLESDKHLSSAERESFPQLMNAKMSTFKRAFETVVGRRLLQGSNIRNEMCELLPQAKAIDPTGSFAVLGVASIKGRESIVIGGEQGETCVLPNGRFTMRVKGWFAYDRQSGLPSNQSLAMETAVPTGLISGTEDRDCTVTGAPVPVPAPVAGASAQMSQNPTQKTSEQRLTELKSLLEKGLITQEQFEQKRAEILKAL